MKRGLKAAFRYVPTNPCDFWLLLMFEWNGVDMFLPFGFLTVSRILSHLQKLFTGSPKLRPNATSRSTTPTIFCLLFLLKQKSLQFPLNSTRPSVSGNSLVRQRPQKRIQKGVSSFIGFEFDSKNAQSPLPSVKSSVRSKQSTHYYCHPQSRFPCSKRHPVSSLVVAQSFPSVVPFSAISSLCSASIIIGIISDSIATLEAISNGGCDFSCRGHQYQ